MSPADIKALIPTRPAFMANSVTKRLREVQRGIQHMEARVLRGEIVENTPFRSSRFRSGNAVE